MHICQSKILLGSFFFFFLRGNERGRGGKSKWGYIRSFFSLGNKMSKSSNSRLNNAKYLYLSTSWEKTPLRAARSSNGCLNSKGNRCARFPLYFHNVHALETITAHAILSQTKLLLGETFKPLNPARHVENMDITQVVFTVSRKHQRTNLINTPFRM